MSICAEKGSSLSPGVLFIYRTWEWRELCVYSHQQTKPQSLQSTQTFVDWNLTCFWQRLTFHHLAFEWLLHLTVRLQCAAKHLILAPTTNTDFFPARAMDPTNIEIPCCRNAKQTDILILSTLEKHVLSQIHHFCVIRGSFASLSPLAMCQLLHLSSLTATQYATSKWCWISHVDSLNSVCISENLDALFLWIFFHLNKKISILPLTISM